MAIGAIASGGVVLSLADVSTGEASVVAHALAAPAQALIGAPEAAQPHAQPVVDPALDLGADDRLGAAVSGTNPKIVEPAGIAKAPTEVGPNNKFFKRCDPAVDNSRAGGKQNDRKSPRCASRRDESCARRRRRLGLGRERVSLVLTASRPMPRNGVKNQAPIKPPRYGL